MSLSYMQEMAILDDRGNCRCPWCGKYRRREDFHDQPASLRFGNDNVRGHIHVAPACDFCRKEEPCRKTGRREEMEEKHD